MIIGPDGHVEHISCGDVIFEYPRCLLQQDTYDPSDLIGSLIAVSCESGGSSCSPVKGEYGLLESAK